MKNNVADTLKARGALYGDFTTHAEVTQALKRVAIEALVKSGKRLHPLHKEALDMIFHKIGRILNGDPDYADSWHDIAGYAQLVEQRLNKK